MRRPSKRGLAAIGLVGGAAAVTAAVVAQRSTSPAVRVEPAARADDPACARIAGHERDDTSTPGVAVWGDGTVVLRCGLEPPARTTDPCFGVNGVDWVFRESRSAEQGRKILITYGRNPAVEAFVSDRITEIDSVLVSLSDVVKPIERKDGKCILPNGR
jgi:hypothetical protein